jgi:cytochrome d ubiquinol oxidase subunit I
MVGIGMLMLAVSWWAAWTLWRQRKANKAQVRRCSQLAADCLLAGMTFSGWVATLAGWYVTEIGRQPFLVYGSCAPPTWSAAHARAAWCWPR